jgi:hypothetical protein
MANLFHLLFIKLIPVNKILDKQTVMSCRKKQQYIGLFMATYFGSPDHHLVNLQTLNLGTCNAVM